MKIDTIIEAGTQAFKQKLMDICKNKEFSELTPELSEEMTGFLKGAVSAAGLASYKAYIESHDTSATEIIRDGITYRYKYVSSKPFMTVFGCVPIERRIYQPDAGGKSYVPLDESWGMSNEFATIDVRETILYSTAHNTPDETASLLKKCALFSPSVTTVKRIVDATGEFFEDHRDEIREAVMASEIVPDNTAAIVSSMDGTNVLLNEKGVRQGRPSERPKPESSGTSDKTAYRNAMVGSTSFYAEKPRDEQYPVRLESRYIARMPEDKALMFKQAFEQELSHVLDDPSAVSLPKILLMDGQRSLWNYAANNPLFKEFEFLLDFYHTTEHLSRAAEALFGKGSQEATAWYKKYRDKLREESDAPMSILRSMEYYQQNYRLSKARRDDLKTEITFFSHNKSKMNYPDFRKRGLPIGSGVIEAACKSVVKTRLCRSGMRWSRVGGQKILDFRAYVKSNRWENCWSEFKKLKNAA